MLVERGRSRQAVRLGRRRQGCARHRGRRHTERSSDKTGGARSGRRCASCRRWWRRTSRGWRRWRTVQKRSRRIFDAFVEDLRGFVFVVPVDVDAGLATSGSRFGPRRGRGLQARQLRRLLVVFALRGCQRGRRRRRRCGGAGHWWRLGSAAHAGRRRRCRKTAWLSLQRWRRRRHAAARRRQCGRHAAARRRRRSARLGGSRQAQESLLPGCRRGRDGTAAAGQGCRRRSARSRLLRRQSVKHVEVRTRLVAHRCCSLCCFTLTLLWRPVFETPEGLAFRAQFTQRTATARGSNLDLETDPLGNFVA